MVSQKEKEYRELKGAAETLDGEVQMLKEAVDGKSVQYSDEYGDMVARGLVEDIEDTVDTISGILGEGETVSPANLEGEVQTSPKPDGHSDKYKGSEPKHSGLQSGTEQNRKDGEVADESGSGNSGDWGEIWD